MPQKLIIEDDDGNIIDLFPNNIKETENEKEKVNQEKKKKVITEDLGKIFEMAICLLYDTSYNGKYKYSMEEAFKIKDQIFPLKELFPYMLTHTAKNGARYDFTTSSESTEIKYLSAKTTKKGDKVCPQVIGQPSKKKFCQHFILQDTYDTPQIKLYIQENVKKMLEKYFEYTFDCDIIYYNQQRKRILFIKKNSDIDWQQYNIEFSHIKNNKEWNESTTISIDGDSIGEFQVHNHRDNIKFRWCFEKLLDYFKDKFEIVHI